jgi:MFS family permease
VASYLSKRLGPRECLTLTLGVGVVAPVVIGLVPLWPVVMVVWAVESMAGTLWNVITVSLRQRLIPDHLLGRVNSGYRFFAWGMMPIGAALGGVTVVVLDAYMDRDWALRTTWFVAAAISLGLLLFGRAKLTTAKIHAASPPADAAGSVTSVGA